MNSDYSWLGLYRKGYKLQWYNKHLKKWINFDNDTELLFAVNLEDKIRYKHSIQS